MTSQGSTYTTCAPTYIMICLQQWRPLPTWSKCSQSTGEMAYVCSVPVTVVLMSRMASHYRLKDTTVLLCLTMTQLGDVRRGTSALFRLILFGVHKHFLTPCSRTVVGKEYPSQIRHRVFIVWLAALSSFEPPHCLDVVGFTFSSLSPLLGLYRRHFENVGKC